MKKRICSFILVLVMMVTMLPVMEIEAKAASNEKPNYTTGVTSTADLTNRLNALMNKYVGTYWTTNGSPCNHKSGCNSKYYNGTQCKGFASYIFNDLFCGGYIGPYDDSNKYCIPSAKNATEVGKIWDFSSSDIAAVKNLLSKAQPGDFIQARRRGQTYGHSMIVVSVDANGIILFDCNSDGKCGVRKYTQTWATFAQKNRGVSLYHSTKYPSGGTPPAPANHTPEMYFDEAIGGMNKVTVRGWAFDRDDLNRQLEIHVYIGDRMIGQGIANKPRGDVHSTFGVGEYHGFEFDCAVPADLTGSQNITVFALDKETINHPWKNLWAVINNDTSAPVISDVKVSDVNDSGYTVSCTVTDDTGVNRVQFPTWTQPEQDDLLQDWIGNPAVAGTRNGDIFTFRVKFSEHNNEKANYATHIYAYDNYDNQGCYNVETYFGLISAQYNVTYDANGGSGAPAAQKKVHDTTLKLSTTKPTKSGSEFAGWNTKADGSGTAYASGAEYKGNAALKLYAQWKHTHNYTSKITTAATCEKNGVKTFTCTGCGHSYTETINAIGHKWNSGEIVKNATCESKGEKKFTCQNDSTHTKTETIPTTEHNVIIIMKDAVSCTEDGYSGDEVCKICEKTLKLGEVIKATGHKWDDGIITKAATCKEEGEKLFTCKNFASHTKIEVIAATGHIDKDNDPYNCDICNESLCEAHDPWDIMGSEPSCTRTGLTVGSRCHNCAMILKQHEIIPAKGHKWDNGEVTKEATCETDGEMKYVCENDESHTKTEPIPATGHTPELKNAKSATCTADGYTGDEVCKNCGKNIKIGEAIKSLGHKWMEDTFVPGCEFDGWTVHWCTRCGEEYEDNLVPATGHKWDDGKIIKEATETVEGTKRYTCTVCKETKDEVIPITIHKHEFKDTVVKPDCTEGGYTLHECACGESYKDTYTDAIGHDTQLKNAKSATCTADGYTGDEVCKNCGKTIKQGETIKAKKHIFAEGKCSECGATDPNYKEPEPIPENPFKDVAESDWFYAPVLWAVQNNVTGGTSPTTFSPDAYCTRAQVVTFLWAANGKPEPTSMNNPFTDVSDSAWYCKAVMWAVEKGITGGTSANTFSPDAYCTRAQVATFLYAAEGKPALKGTASGFSDVSDSAWYITPVMWAVENDVTGGIGGGKFGPDQTCTRAQIATFLYKAMS